MKLFGNNTAYGTGRVELGETRVVEALVEGEPLFPLGVGGLLPVVTERKKKGPKTVWAFPLGASEQAEGEGAQAKATDGTAEAEGAGCGDAAAQADASTPGTCQANEGSAAQAGEGACDGAACGGPETQAGDATLDACEAEGTGCAGSAAPASSSMASDTARIAVFSALNNAVRDLNRMLDLAVKFARYEFGVVNGVFVGVGPEGYGFTRVEVVPKDAHGQPSPTPVHLHIETSDKPGEPYTLSAVIEYARDGKPWRMVITEFGEYGDTCKVTASVNEKSGKLSVAKVEQFRGGEREGRLLYKRGWEPKERDRSSTRSRGWDDGGWAAKHKGANRGESPRGVRW